jgi:hypothetical protein
VNRFIEHSQLVTARNYISLTRLHTLKTTITTEHNVFDQRVAMKSYATVEEALFSACALGCRAVTSRNTSGDIT